MKVLVGWDNAKEAETIDLLLNVGDIEARVTTEADQFVQAASSGCWDAIVMALNFPSVSESFAMFETIRARQADTPILGACHQGQVVHLARFMSHGLHNFVTRDPDGQFILLLPSVIEMAHTAVQAQRTHQLTDRLREEIESVRQLQESVIPHDIPMPPGYKIAARYEPAEIRVFGDQPVVLAGGDYYDIFSLDNQNVIIVVGDAAGHGIKACMSIMTMRTLIRMIRDHSYVDTAHFMAEVNRRMVDYAIVSQDGGFITLLYCALDTAAHTLQWTSAGHPMPLLQDLVTGEIMALGGYDKAGMPLGIDSEATYHSVTSCIPPNSRLLLYSDGLADAFPACGEHRRQFGEAGIRGTLRSTAGLAVDQALDRLFADSNAFTRGAGRHDDASVVLIDQNGARVQKHAVARRQRAT
jgi:serine phosphatase RsbU (regulator of sigma subunit)